MEKGGALSLVPGASGRTDIRFDQAAQACQDSPFLSSCSHLILSLSFGLEAY